MRVRPHVAVVTCRDLPVPASDDALLVDALGAEAVTSTLVPWDEDDVDWSFFAGVVLRSTWDYHRRLDEFLGWVVRAGADTPMWNPPAVVEANAHKRYLLGLADAGVPVVPTTLVPRHTHLDLAELVAAHGDVVVKPAVGAGARSTYRVRTAGDLDASTLAELTEAGDVLVQPFVPSIVSHGETSVVWLDGGTAHAWRARPTDGDFRVERGPTGVVETIDPSPTQVEVAEAAVASVRDAGHDLISARVDLVEIDGEPHVMELELIEPDLRLREHPASLAWLAAAIPRRVRTDD